MHKPKLLIISLFLLLSFSACFSDKNTDSNIENETTEDENSLSGTLRYIGSIGYKGAHYFLEQSDQSIIYLIHEDSDEEFLEYKNKEVVVEGEFLDKSTELNQKSIFEVEKIEYLTVSDEDSSMDKSAILEYTNYDLGIKFKFKKNFWAIKNEAENAVTLRYEYLSDSSENKSQVLPSVTISLLNDKLDINEENIEDTQNNEESLSPLYEWVEKNNAGAVLTNYNIGPDNIAGVKVDVSSSKTAIYLSRINEIYLIEFQSPTTPEFSDADLAFVDITSSFQFIAKSYGTQSTLIDVSEPSEEGITNEDESDELEKKYMELADTFSKLTDFAFKNVQGGYQIESFEFVKDKNYVYIILKDEVKRKKILMSYDEDLTTFTELAYYEAGEEVTWQKIEGEDTVSKDPKIIININELGETSNPIEMKEGYTYLESKAYKFRIQYPSSWYYVSLGNGSYAFSNEQFESGKQKVSLEIVAGSINENSKNTKISEQGVELYAKRNDNESYKISGPSEFQEQLQNMIDSIEEL